MARPTQEERTERAQQAFLQKVVAVVQAHLDTTAANKGYGDSRTAPSVSARSYAGYTNPFQAECIAYGQWCAACWATCYQVLAEVQAGTRAIPTIDELVAMLPAFTWE